MGKSLIVWQFIGRILTYGHYSLEVQQRKYNLPQRSHSNSIKSGAYTRWCDTVGGRPPEPAPALLQP